MQVSVVKEVKEVAEVSEVKEVSEVSEVTEENLKSSIIMLKSALFFLPVVINQSRAYVFLVPLLVVICPLLAIG